MKIIIIIIMIITITIIFRNHPFISQEKELEETKASGNVGQWKAELEESQREKRRLESDLSRLRDEQQTMHLQSTTQAKLDMTRKQKEVKEDAIQKM